MSKLSRRQFLQWTPLVAVSPYLSSSWATNQETPSYISAYSNTLGQYGVALLTHQGEIKHTHELDSRGHSFAINPIRKEIYCISRRPGYTIDIVDSKARFIQQIRASSQRHFYGHGVCSPDGRLLYTTENNLENGQGVIGIRDMHQHGLLLGEYSTFGIGPHSIELSSDHRYLVVANGGVKTHPMTGRKKLNLKNMSPSLTFIDRLNGELHRKAMLAPEYFQNSIRHFALTPDNDAIIALQNQSDKKTHEVLLAHYHYSSHQIHPIRIPRAIQNQLNGYLGDVVFDHSYQSIATSSPRGGLVIFYRPKDQTLWHDTFDDSCGVRAIKDLPQGFMVSNGGGEIRQYHLGKQLLGQLSKQVLAHQEVRWDNHLMAYAS